jgi:hypothetical protein
MNDSEIVEAGRLMLALWQSPDEEVAAHAQRLDVAMAKMDFAERHLVFLAMKILAGSSYGVCTDNPENAKRYRSLAEHMGATVTEVDQSETHWAGVLKPMINLRFDPPRAAA